MLSVRSGREDRLRHVRHTRASFDGQFFEQHADYWPIARAAKVFAEYTDWPEPKDYAQAFLGVGPVSFELALPRRRRPRGQGVSRTELYDAVIVGRRVVPTRARMWHDFLNALVWATFPRAKLALHERQHRAIQAWIPEGATELPNARTRELDAIALVDEGGVVVLLGERGERIPVLFGHALFESLVFGQPAMIARSVILEVRGAVPSDPSELLGCVDAGLSAALADPARFQSPDELPRHVL